MPVSYGTVFALNILDRVENSREFLNALIGLLEPGGRLVVALPLPYCAKPWVAGGGQSAATSAEAADWAAANALPSVPGGDWEESALMVGQALRSGGLRVEKVARAPYMCTGFEKGDEGGELLYVLDAAIFVCTACQIE